eukprot:TRINITY_DN3004_c0_g2_i1.p2 TRINITY_DN3004_c0_g2~~TRINITY_DN3004_c0_g2_i1.p2  ORF type:complete len:189 (+),score=-11.92 TRINITY_DN3004_c0_g2_i1:125-691(+)
MCECRFSLYVTTIQMQKLPPDYFTSNLLFQMSYLTFYIKFAVYQFVMQYSLTKSCGNNFQQKFSQYLSKFLLNSKFVSQNLVLKLVFFSLISQSPQTLQRIQITQHVTKKEKYTNIFFMAVDSLQQQKYQQNQNRIDQIIKISATVRCKYYRRCYKLWHCNTYNRTTSQESLLVESFINQSRKPKKLV